MCAQECTGRTTMAHSSCVARLADGWIVPSDLCPSCTRAFMAAMDGIAGSLTWHAGFRSRADR
jgi:hypothetical protein